LTLGGTDANHVGRPRAGASIARDIVRRSILGIALLVAVAAACTAAPAADFPIASLTPRLPSPSPSPSPILQMPDVTGLAYADAADVLHARGFKVKKERKYSASSQPQEVLKQSRKVGEIVPVGSVVTLTIAIPIPPAINGNPWGYNWGCCHQILDPPADFCSFFACVLTFHNGTGFVVQCEDGQFSLTGGTGRETCISHKGYKRTLYAP
jgi:PASTA domain